MPPRSFLEAQDFLNETIITYPVAECRLDLYTRFLEPAGIVPNDRRTAELTTMIVQWVTAGVGCALPQWALPSNNPDLVTLPLGEGGLWADLYALRREEDQSIQHMADFISRIKRECFERLRMLRKCRILAQPENKLR